MRVCNITNEKCKNMIWDIQKNDSQTREISITVSGFIKKMLKIEICYLSTCKKMKYFQISLEKKHDMWYNYEVYYNEKEYFLFFWS